MAVLHLCTIEDGALAGIGAIILNRAVVGRGSVIAAGALISEDMRIEPGSLVVGVPGKVMGTVSAELTARVEATWAHYVDRTRAQLRAAR